MFRFGFIETQGLDIDSPFLKMNYRNICRLLRFEVIMNCCRIGCQRFYRHRASKNSFTDLPYMRENKQKIDEKSNNYLVIDLMFSFF